MKNNNNNISSKSHYNFNQNSYSYSYNLNFKNKLSNNNNINKHNNCKKKNKKKIRSSLPSQVISTNYLIKSPNYILNAFNNDSFKENISNKMEINHNKDFSLQFRNKNQIYSYNKNKKYEN